MLKLLKVYRVYLQNASWVAALTLTSQVMRLAFYVVIVREISMADVGQYQLVIAIIGLCGFFTLPNMSRAVMQSVARGHLATFRKALLYQFLGGLLGGTVIFIYGLLFLENVLLHCALVAGTLFPFAYGLSGWKSFQVGQGKFRSNAYWGCSIAVISYGTMILLLLLADVSLIWLIFVPNFVSAVFNIVVLSFVYRQIPNDARPESDAIAYGLRSSMYSVANNVGNNIDKLLIYYFHSPEILAVFFVADRIPDTIKNYLQSIRQVLVPSFSNKSIYTGELNKKLNWIGLFISVGIIFLAFGVVPWLIPLAFTDSYSEAVLYCQLLLGTLIIGQIAQVRSVFLYSRLDAIVLRNVTLGSNFVRVVSSVALVPSFGVYGAIASTALYRCSTAILMTLMLRRYSP